MNAEVTIEHQSRNTVLVDGEKVKFAHFRILDDDGNVEPRGGATVAYLGTRENITAAGLSYCSEDDNFAYQYGRDKAIGRLLQGVKGGMASDEPATADVRLNPVKFIRDWTAEEVESEMNLYGFSRF